MSEPDCSGGSCAQTILTGPLSAKRHDLRAATTLAVGVGLVIAPSRSARSSSSSSWRAAFSSSLKLSSGTRWGLPSSTERRVAKNRAYARSRSGGGAFGEFWFSHEDTVAEERLSPSASADANAACVSRTSSQCSSRSLRRRPASFTREGEASVMTHLLTSTLDLVYNALCKQMITLGITSVLLDSSQSTPKLQLTRGDSTSYSTESRRHQRVILNTLLNFSRVN